MSEGEAVVKPPRSRILKPWLWLKQINQSRLPPNRNILTSEEVIKTDKDIASIIALQSFARQQKRLMAISGGYAVEAHCGGKITRPHGDIDCHYYLEKGFNLNQVTAELVSLLNQEQTAWQLHSADSGKIEFRENAPSLPFAARRRIELLLFTHSNKDQTQAKTLTDSLGHSHPVEVAHLSILTAHKIRIFFEQDKPLPAKRSVSRTDISDLTRLINQPGFNKAEVVATLADYYHHENKDTMSHQQALSKALEEWEKIQGILAIG